jgi:hypothetical protein
MSKVISRYHVAAVCGKSQGTSGLRYANGRFVATPYWRV